MPDATPSNERPELLQAEIARLKEQLVEQQQLLHVRHEQLARQADTLVLKSIDLLEIDEVKSRFYADVSHEFRTPLTLILGPVQDALGGAFGDVAPALRQQLLVVQRNGLRLLRQINQILDLAHLESGTATLHARPAPLRPFVEDIVACFEGVAARKRIRYDLRAELDDEAVPYDPDKLEKVVYNLLSNAFKFTPEGGAVRVSLRREAGEEGDRIVFSVRDSGPGMRAEQVPHVFDRFYSSSARPRTPHQGIGIGLALARELVALHGGEIRVESEEHFGSTFTFTLPVGREDAGAALRDGEPAPHVAVDSYADLDVGGDGAAERAEGDAHAGVDVPSILIVDDNREIRDYVRLHLEGSYRVLEAPDGAAALTLAREEWPDLVVSDVLMPGMDGYDLCHTLHEDPELSYIPVILLTVKSSPSAKMEGLREGAVDYLTKPFDARELRLKVDNLIYAQRRTGRASAAGPVHEIHASEIEVQSDDALFLQQVQSLVELHMADETFNVAALAAEVGISRVHLYRRLRALLNESPADVIRRMRLERAAQLLAAGAGQVSEIAYGVGFKSVAHFSRVFRATYGETPTGYRAGCAAAEDQ